MRQERHNWSWSIPLRAARKRLAFATAFDISPEALDFLVQGGKWGFEGLGRVGLV
jgi:hypothetical protein